MGTLYETILHLCDQRGIKPGKVCNDLGISRGIISDLKAGRKKSLSADYANKIANYFGVSVDYLLSGVSEQKETPATQMGDEDDETKALYDFIRAASPEERKELINIANYIKSRRNI